MTRPTRQRLSDLIQATGEIAAHEMRLEQVGIGRDEQVRLDAVVRQLAIVSEAAAHLPDELVATEPGIPWRDVRGIRIVLDRGYHRVDPAIIWRTVDSELPPLREAAIRMSERLAE